MANIMSTVKLNNKTSRNGFDLSRKNAFTAKVGELLPVVCMECLPGDSFDLEVQHFTRTRPVNTAAYTRIREYYDWFFVPSNLLWNKFHSVITQMYDNGQHAQGISLNSSLNGYLPCITTSQVKNYLSSMKGKLNYLGYDRSSLSSKLLSYLGYGDYSFASNDSYTDGNALLKELFLNPFPLLAYQKVFQDYFRNSQWERAYAPAWNLDYIDGGGSPNLIPIEDIDKNVMNMFDLRYRNWNKDLFMGVLPSAQYGSAATISSGDSSDASLSEFRSSLSFLKVANTTSSNRDAIVAANNDYLTIGNDSNYPQIQIGLADIARLRTSLGFTDTNSTSFSILQLRYAEAQQMWAEITQSQQQDYKSQIEAHWNVNLSDAYSERAKYIGGSVSNLDISEVVNTNITADNEAQVAGKGVGVGQGREKFKTDVHGYLMCIYSAVPLLDYSISGVKKMCTRTTATDFAIPEFDNVGMESLGIEHLVNTVFQTRVPTSYELIQNLGYVPRYIDYKVAYDEINGAFRKEQDGLNDWVAPLSNRYFEEYFANLASSGIGLGGSLTYQFFKVNPNILDPIFDVNADSSVSSDQLWINAAFDIKAVRNLDRNGLPY